MIASASAISIRFLETPGWCLGRQLQSWVGQVQSVHDLIVLVVGRRVWITGEGIDVGSLQVDHPSAFPVEEEVLSWVIEFQGLDALIQVKIIWAPAEKGLKISQIAAELQLDPKTVEKWVDQPTTPAKELLAEFWRLEKEAEKLLEGLVK